MVVVLIGQRNTALRVLLKRPHKPELSPVGGRTLTLGHTWARAADFSARLGCTCTLAANIGAGARGTCLSLGRGRGGRILLAIDHSWSCSNR